MNEQPRYWFPAKKFGVGFGLPVAWQGWVVIGLYVAALAMVYVRFPPDTDAVPFYAGVLAATSALVLIVWFKGDRK
ncbi:hypothetical protein [Lysobacter sp. HA35]